MKSTLSLMTFLALAALVSGCAAGIKRTGYSLPANTKPEDLKACPIVMQANAKYNTNEVTVLGAIRAYDTGMSVGCDEAEILDIFAREGCMLGADLINITDEKQPNPWTSSCYRANATFIRFNDREKAKTLVSDAKYSPDQVIERTVAASKRTREIIVGTVLGGAVGAVVVTVATDTSVRTNAAVTSPRASP